MPDKVEVPVEVDLEAFLASTVTELADPIFQGKWPTLPDSEKILAVEKFKTLFNFVTDLRVNFDDALTVCHAKGTCENIEHIRKPYAKKEAPTSMVEMLKASNKKKSK
jgi:hypothetical protein